MHLLQKKEIVPEIDEYMMHSNELHRIMGKDRPVRKFEEVIRPFYFVFS